MNFTKRYQLKPGRSLNLAKWDADDTAGWEKPAAQQKLAANTAQIAELQYRLYADARRSLLVVLQGMDASGKDGTVRHVFGPVNPRLPGDGVQSAHSARTRPRFSLAGAPGRTRPRRDRHFQPVTLRRRAGRARQQTRSPAVWQPRYDRINEFEQLLADSGTVILKFFLHISKAEQKERLQARLDDPQKNWKFELADLDMRAKWDQFQRAYEDALQKCSTAHGPWFVIPANKKWFRNLAVSEIVVETLSRIPFRFPRPKIDLSKVRIR